MAMAIMIEKQSSKVIRPFVQTPPTFSSYKLGFIDEFAPAINIGVVLFFSTNSDDNHNPKFFDQLEKSLGKTLARFYPLAGRHDVKTTTIDYNDQGAEFTHAKVNIKLQDFLVSQVKDKLIDEFIPFKIGAALQQRDPLLAAQVTAFECGGVAIGVSATHKVVDASTLCTLINEWAVTNREENEINLTGNGFNSSCSLFPACGLSSIPAQPMNDDMLKKYMRKKLSFSESVISNMKAAKGKKRWSKVQLITAIIWKTFMAVDMSIHNYQRDSQLFQAVSLREKMASLIPKNSCGNLWCVCATECKAHKTTEELTDLLTDSVKKLVTNFSKGHHNHEEGQEIVLNSLLSSTSINLESTNVVWISSWCKFPFYEVNFGFGKPIWVAPGTIPVKNLAYMIDDAEGNGVEAYVFLEVKDVSYFEAALGNIVNAFAA